MKELSVCPSTLQQGFSTYSPRAIKRLFDGAKVSHILPYESSSAAGIKSIMNSCRQRLSLSGVQSKFPLLVDNGVLRFTHEGETATHILKPRLSELLYSEYSPANEHLTMQIAEQVFGITTAANGLCFFENGETAYITRRYDVDNKGHRWQQEDFASLAGITSETHGANFKYDAVSYEEIANIIHQYLETWRVEMVKFYDIMLFNFLFSNGDAHLKNFSILRRSDGDYGLAPAYDLINTQLHIPDDTIFALSKGLFAGSDQHKEYNMTTGHTFLVFGETIGLSKRLAEKELARFCKERKMIETMVENSFLSDELKQQYLDKYYFRRQRLSAFLGD